VIKPGKFGGSTSKSQRYNREKLPGTRIPVELLQPDYWVIDIIYFPMETEFLRAARERGCHALSGAGMAVHQAVRAFALFTGLEPDPKRMKETFKAFEKESIL